MKLSVVVPMYNSEKYIERCINSIIAQDMKCMEIILINDGSTDKTKYIAEKYVEKYKNIKLIDKEKNEGLSAARNTGIKNAIGEYIVFIDSDDEINNGMFTNMYELGKKSDSDLVMCSYLRKYKDFDVEIKANIKEDYVIYNRSQVEKIIIPTFVENIEYGYYYAWNKLYKRKFLEKHDILFREKIKFGEDWFFNLELFDKINTFAYINKPYYNYFDNIGSQSKNIDKDRIKLYLDGHKIKHYFIKKYDLESKYVDIKLLEEIYVYIYSLLLSNEPYKTKKNIIKSLSTNRQFLECLYCIKEQPKFIRYTLFLLKINYFNLLNLSINLYDKCKKRR